MRRRDTWPPLDRTFFSTLAARKIPLPHGVQAYFRRLMGVEPTIEQLLSRRMEEVFKDVFYDLLETPSDRIAFDAYVELVDLYLRVLRETTNWLGEDRYLGGPVGRLVAAVAGISERLTVITFNHDLVIENEIQKRALLRRRWCLDQGYGSLSPELTLLTPVQSQPVFSMHSDGDCDHRVGITLLKLHGSLNWSVRISGANPTVNYLSGRTAARQVYLLTTREITARTRIVRRGAGRSEWQTWPVVVPPVYAKQALRSAIQTVWSDARVALEGAGRVVFYGYSLPAIDVEAEKLFERALATNSELQWIDVVNPDPDSAARYAGLAPATPVRWYGALPEFFDAEGWR